MKKNKSLHLSLGDDLLIPLKEFSITRDRSMSEIIRYALDKMFSTEHADNTQEILVRTILNRYFRIPTGYTSTSFYITLYMFSRMLPDAKVKDTWGEAIYMHTDARTNKQLFMDITQEKKKLVENAK